jgi:predicted house-cleaning noncanonical NTP pyrophosphatase (MazG superfamily)
MGSFRRFKYNKLVRHRMVEFFEKMGSTVQWACLGDDEFKKELKIKFMEEAQEVHDAKTRQELIEELADVLEVVASLCDVHQFTMQDIVDAQIKKRAERGEFKGRVFVGVVEHMLGSAGERYCLADSEKYPEIKD